MGDSMFDKAKEKGKELLGQHADKADQGVDKAAELADQKTGGQHGDKIQQGADKVKDRMRQETQQNPQQSPQQPQ